MAVLALPFKTTFLKGNNLLKTSLGCLQLFKLSQLEHWQMYLYTNLRGQQFYFAFMELIDLNLDTYWKVLQLDFKCNTVEQLRVIVTHSKLRVAVDVRLWTHWQHSNLF